MRTLLFLLAAISAAAQSWKPAPVTLTTPWGEKVTPANAWREYPRPQFVRDRWENLNGLWDYAITSKTAPVPSKFDGQILVPFAVESSLSGVGKPLHRTSGCGSAAGLNCPSRGRVNAFCCISAPSTTSAPYGSTEVSWARIVADSMPSALTSRHF